MESAVYNKLRKEGVTNPFDVRDQVVICSYQFASKKAIDLQLVPWDLVIIDEAHRLRNVYKSNNVMGKKLKKVLAGRKKLLLTATPLQNNLMELYGLASIIDDRVFGDDKTFREMYVSVANTDIRNQNLKKRLDPLCKRTLRKQVSEYVPYTGRHAILREYTPTADEEKNCITMFPSIYRRINSTPCPMDNGRLSRWCCASCWHPHRLPLQVRSSPLSIG